MQCPICNQPMKQAGEDTSNNLATGQKYTRTVYHCEADDVWGNIEIPKQPDQLPKNS